MSLTLVVLAAGAGQRYGGLKQLEPVGPGGEVLLEYSVFDALRAGFDRVVVVVRPETEERFRRALEAMNDRCRLGFARQEARPGPASARPWGTGHAVLAAAPFVRGSFVVVNADDHYGAESFAAAGEFSRAAGRAPSTVEELAVVGFRLGRTLSDAGPVSRALLEQDEEGYLVDVVERTEVWREGEAVVCRSTDGGVVPVVGDPWVSMNMWCLSPSFLAGLRGRFDAFVHSSPDDAEFLLPEVVRALIDEGTARVRVLRSEATWAGLTFPGDTQRVRALLAEQVAAGRYPRRLWR